MLRSFVGRVRVTLEEPRLVDAALRVVAEAVAEDHCAEIPCSRGRTVSTVEVARRFSLLPTRIVGHTYATGAPPRLSRKEIRADRKFWEYGKVPPRRCGK